MGEEHFPYTQCQWGGNDETKRRWYEILERTGPANVRARLCATACMPPKDFGIGRGEGPF
jgi:hypothetical protein